MGSSETEALAAELYLVPPARFVAARDALVRQAREAGHRELAGELGGLRRPTVSAWLVNLLTRHERERMEGLVALGRELRQAQTRLDGVRVRELSVRRQELVADLLARARALAAEAGVRPTDAALAEVRETLHAALVDLAGSVTVLAGRLVRPMSYSGFGPLPQVSGRPQPPPVPEEEPEPEPATVWAPEPFPSTAGGLRLVEPVGAVEPPPDAPRPGEDPDTWALRRAEAELAAAESAHWQSEHDLADAEAAVEAAGDRLEWLDHQRIEARRGKATAERHVAEAREAQHVAVRTVEAARRAVDAARHRLRERPGGS